MERSLGCVPHWRKAAENVGLSVRGRGEAPRVDSKGTAASVAKRDPEDPASTSLGHTLGRVVDSLTSRTAVVRTRTPGGVTGKAREGIPMSIVVRRGGVEPPLFCISAFSDTTTPP